MDQAENLRSIMRLKNEGSRGIGARVITVTSGKGGVGKSSLAINLAIQMQKLGKRVVVFDADFGLANIEVMLGTVPKYNLADMIYKGKDIKDIIIKGPNDISFISGGSGVTSLRNMTKDQIGTLIFKLQELEDMADVIIVDTGAGIADSVLEFVASAGEVLLVTTPEPTSITDSYALLKALNVKNGANKSEAVIKMVANRVKDASEGQDLYEKLNAVVNKFLNINLEFLGYVPQDDSISKAVIKQTPVSISYPSSSGARAFENLAATLLNKQVTTEKRTGFAQMFLNMLRRR